MRIPRGICVIAAAAAWWALAPAAAPESSNVSLAAFPAPPVVAEPPPACCNALFARQMRLPHRERGTDEADGGGNALFARQMRWRSASPSSLVALAEDGAAHGPLWYDQNPRLLRADHAGGLALDDFLIAGDVATLTFLRPSVSAENHVVRETWRRTGTTDIDGHLISVFNPRWDSAALWDAISWQRRGFDHPYVHLGTLLAPRPSEATDTAGDGAVERFFIKVRMAPLNVPPAQVRQIDDATQYASHVVNLVMPDFGDGRLSDGDYGHALDEVARRFYAHFRDEYASIAIVPRQQHVVPYDAFHHNVRNPIGGLGALPVFDDSEAYGSAGVLRSVELFPDVSFTSNAASTHAIAHQWADYWDWSALAGGVERAGRSPGSHTPLLFPGEVYSGAVLDVTRRVAALRDGTGYAIERTAGPAVLHPTTLYRMGLIGPEAVPEVLVFENQGQFNATDSAEPDAGTVIEGGYRRVHINDVLAEHGSRSGPADTEWSRATVVVSRDGLLSPEEMSYWNFFAARHAATAGTTTWEGAPSFFEATGSAVPLRTDVTPLHAAGIDEAVTVGHMPIAAGEFRDVQLDAPVPARIAVGESVTIAGTVTTTERDDFNTACALWYHHGQESYVYECDSITGNRFSIPYRFTAGDAGRYALWILLYYPDSPSSQLPRSSISGITVGG